MSVKTALIISVLSDDIQNQIINTLELIKKRSSFEAAIALHMNITDFYEMYLLPMQCAHLETGTSSQP